MKKEYSFTIDFINEILRVLGEQKAKDVFTTILAIHQEVTRQDQEVKEE
jgi:hypothetical protein